MYEPETQRAMREILKPGDSFVIAGAHRGVLASVAAALVGPQGKVFAFEPEKKNFAGLKKATKDFGNVRTFNCALGEKECHALFFYNSDNDGGHALWDVSRFTNNTESQKNPISYKVKVRSIDRMDEDFSKVRLMLFDVEGAEHAVLKGAINTITDYGVPFIICEINNAALERCGTSQAALKSFMAVYGYKVYSLMPNTVEELSPSETVSLIVEDEQIVYNVLFAKKRLN